MSAFHQVKSIIRSVLSASAVRRLRRGAAWLALRLPLSRALDLETLASVYGAEKEKRFIELYAAFFSRYRTRKINLLEIGIGGAGNPQKGGGSLRMWSCYFRRGKVFGIDLYDKTPHDLPGRIATFKGDQSDVEMLRRVVEEIGRLDIVIDDGSHRNADVIRTLSFLSPLLADDGIYVIEDVQTSYWQAYGGSSDQLESPTTTMGLLKRWVDGLNYQEFELSEYRPSYIDEFVKGLYFAHNIVFIFKGDNRAASNILGKRW